MEIFFTAFFQDNRSELVIDLYVYVFKIDIL